MTTSAALEPHQDTLSFRYKATGRLWKLEGQSSDGPIRLTGNFFGPESYLRVYVTPEELSEDYEPVIS
jgi:hypothetical protein